MRQIWLSACLLLGLLSTRAEALPGLKQAVTRAVRQKLAAQGVTPRRIELRPNGSLKITEDGPNQGERKYMFYWRAEGQSGTVFTVPKNQRNKLFLVSTSISDVGAGINWSKP